MIIYWFFAVNVIKMIHFQRSLLRLLPSTLLYSQLAEFLKTCSLVLRKVFTCHYFLFLVLVCDNPVSYIDGDLLLSLSCDIHPTPKRKTITSRITYLTLSLFLVGHDVGYHGPPFFPVGSNFPVGRIRCSEYNL